MGLLCWVCRGRSNKRSLLGLDVVSALRNAAFASYITVAFGCGALAQPAGVAGPPTPLLSASQPVSWLFVYKFNAASFPTAIHSSDCIFTGRPVHGPTGQQYVYASSDFGALINGEGLIGTSLSDPVGATFNEIYNGNLNFVVWNDQFNGHPKVAGCSDDCDSPWGHMKGILAWDDQGNGVIMQVSTPVWPGSGTAQHPRAGDGNTLGCTNKDNVKFAQHFFALKLSPADTAIVLDALANSSAPADVGDVQIARLSDPQSAPIGDRQMLANLASKARRLGKNSAQASTTVIDTLLSSGVRLISKPSKLEVPPWQLVSALLGGVSLRTATWADPAIPEANGPFDCWRSDLGTPGKIEVALTGRWMNKLFGVSASNSHAKLGFSLDDTKPLVIFGDLNQQGALNGNCRSAQNGRGGMFFVIEDRQLYASMRLLIPDDVALIPPPKKTKALHGSAGHAR